MVTENEIVLDEHSIEQLNTFIRCLFYVQGFKADELVPFASISTATRHRLASGNGVWTPASAANFINHAAPLVDADSP